ncbi:MAG: hypothetical protein ABSD38_01105 [Syntrophorhabdales bacterium]|jgi:hypothetical protein
MGWRDYQFPALHDERFVDLTPDEPTSEEVLESAHKVEKIAKIEPCRICGENAWWLSVYGALRCGVCHPPVPGAVKKWIGDPDTLRRIKANMGAVILSWEWIRERKAARGRGMVVEGEKT